jgi:hypothetical protein
MIRSVIDVDSTEKMKLNLYILSLIICLFSGFFCYYFRNVGALSFTFSYGIFSLFSLLMGYFHCGYVYTQNLINNNYHCQDDFLSDY